MRTAEQDAPTADALARQLGPRLWWAYTILQPCFRDATADIEIDDIAALLGTSRSTAERVMTGLNNAGAIIKRRTGRANEYQIVRPIRCVM